MKERGKKNQQPDTKDQAKDIDIKKVDKALDNATKLNLAVACGGYNTWISSGGDEWV